MRQDYANEAATLAPQQPVTSEFANRLSTLGAILGDVDSDLCSLRDRTLGAVTRGVHGSTEKAPSNGQLLDLVAGMDALIERANRIREESQILNSRI